MRERSTGRVPFLTHHNLVPPHVSYQSRILYFRRYSSKRSDTSDPSKTTITALHPHQNTGGLFEEPSIECRAGKNDKLSTGPVTPEVVRENFMDSVLGVPCFGQW